eukprot:CAMPEP_0184734468 /NCGR_PEP_ID=MMETSP0314-20130426/60594_1 /TAXON_ID=38298 /ORGANISM="Rhodella maculata, Strain CCMP 736" /LENGTH=54 /DNA_ID=CAMNT_0027201423 /DNA_START=273 /DNA_END=437 /DNA_ORIENTATION=+
MEIAASSFGALAGSAFVLCRTTTFRTVSNVCAAVVVDDGGGGGGRGEALEEPSR